MRHWLFRFFRPVLLLLLSVAIPSASIACSSFRVVSEDGSVFFVFNFELGGSPSTRVLYYPAGTDFVASAPEGREPAAWTSKYAVSGMGWFDQPMLAGGINEHGLAAANLNLPNYTTYQDATAADDGKILAAWDVPSFS
jgi:penicillin V acylase-like amidase (Ntn superfamily)